MANTFQECVLVPLALWKRCNIGDTDKAQQILQNPTIPTEVKMKLYSQEKKLSKSNKDSISNKKRQSEMPAITFENIISKMDSQSQPFVRSILHKASQHPDQISWDSKLQVTIDGKVFHDSNLIEILNFLMKKKIVTNDADIPKGSSETIEKLHQIGVPSNWIKVQIPRRSSRVSRISSWLSL